MPKIQKNTYQQYLEERHSQFSVSNNLLAYVVKRATGVSFISKTRLIKGENSEVYSITTERNQEIIVRISHAKNSPYDRENWAISECKKLNLPVPEVLFSGEVKFGEEKVFVSVQNKLPGVSLNELEGEEKSRLAKKIVVQAGEVLGKIHSINIKGFGSLNEKGQGEFSNFTDYILDKLNGSQELLKNESKRFEVDLDQVKNGLIVAKSNMNLLDNVNKSVLLHNDYSPKHILVNNGEISGVLDFETVHGGYPIQEFARWNFYYGDEFPLDWLREGYQDKSIFDESFDNQIHLFRLIFGLDVLAYYVREKNSHGINHSKEEIKKDLEYFTSK